MFLGYGHPGMEAATFGAMQAQSSEKHVRRIRKDASAAGRLVKNVIAFCLLGLDNRSVHSSLRRDDECKRPNSQRLSSWKWRVQGSTLSL